MEILVGNAWSRLTGYVPEKVLENVTSYFVDGAWFAPSFKKGYWDGRVRFAKKQKDKSILVPTGFLSRLTKAFDEIDCPYNLEDNRDLFPPDPIYELHDEKRGSLSLDQGRYDYQGHALRTALSHGRGILKIATGGGKTEIGGAIIKSLNVPSIWLTHRGTLAEQTQKRLQERLQRDVPIYGYGNWKTSDVMILMVQTARAYKKGEYEAMIKAMKGAQLIICDEAHHAEADDMYNAMMNIDAPWRFMLTATPALKGPGMGLLAATGDIIVNISAWDLIERHVLVPPRIWALPVDGCPDFEKKAKWQTVYSQGIVHNNERNNWIRFLGTEFRNEGKPTLSLVTRLNHGDHLADLLCASGVKTEFLCGRDSTAHREATLRKLQDREIHHVIGQVACFGEGIDIPDVRAIINATGTSGGGDASEDEENGRLTKQILGRGLRRSPGKHYVDYVDFVDKGHKSLTTATASRFGTLEAEGYGPFIKYWSEYSQRNSL